MPLYLRPVIERLGRAYVGTDSDVPAGIGLNHFVTQILRSIMTQGIDWRSTNWVEVEFGPYCITIFNGRYYARDSVVFETSNSAVEMWIHG